MNSYCIEIKNCCDCNYGYQEQIYTADSFEHETGLYCSLCEDDKSYNHRHKLVVADDWDVRKYAQIPDWCPIIKELEKEEERNE